jgi:hypothetical protein
MALHCFQPTRDGRAPRLDVDPDDEAREGADRAVRCAACGHQVTTEHAVTEVQGRSDHTFFNPAGVIFEIRCFDRAPGCQVHGDATTEFSWFAGYAWSYALCGACSHHLGWYFEGDGPGFFGLIVGKLTG